HEELNNHQYHDIYSQSDFTLRSRIGEEDFATQLRNAHDELGTTSGKAIVIIDDRVWRNIHLRRVFGSTRQIISNVSTPRSDLIFAVENFSWAVENDQPKLVSYDIRS